MEALGQRMINAIHSGNKRDIHQPSTAAVGSGGVGARNTDTAAADPDNGSGETVEVVPQNNMLDIWLDSSNRVHLQVIEDAGHACKGHEKEVVDLVCEFLGLVQGEP